MHRDDTDFHALLGLFRRPSCIVDHRLHEQTDIVWQFQVISV